MVSGDVINESTLFQGHSMNIELRIAPTRVPVCVGITLCCVPTPNNDLGCSLGPWQAQDDWNLTRLWKSLAFYCSMYHNASQHSGQYASHTQ